MSWSDSWILRCRAVALHRHRHVERRQAAGEFRRTRARRAFALQIRLVDVLGIAARWLFAEPASGGVRGVVRALGDRAQPVPDRTARWRPHLVFGARHTIDLRDVRDAGRRRDAVVLLTELDRLDRPDDR